MTTAAQPTEQVPDGNLPEQWLPIEGYGDLYEVSSAGRVRSLGRVVERSDMPHFMLSGRVLTATINRSRGYLGVHLYCGGRSRFIDVHKLVCAAFRGPRPEGQEVRHLNDVKTDNRAENLCWGTKSQNSLDAVRNGTHPMARKTQCKRGHQFDEANTRIGTNGSRWCRACKRLSDAKRRAVKRQLKMEGEAA